MDITDDVLDFLVFLVLLGVCVAVAFGAVLPAVYDSGEMESLVVRDKTAPEELGYVNRTENRDHLTPLEVALMLRVQDISLPKPNILKFTSEDGTEQVANFNADFFGDIDNSVRLFYDFITSNSSSPESKYTVEFSFGELPAESDDFYYLLEHGN